MSIEELDEIYFDHDNFDHDNGWFVGNLITNGNAPYIVGDIWESDPEYIVHEFWMPVHPESVGQYTGLKDKNGTEIYEGDILEVKHLMGRVVGELIFKHGAFLLDDGGYSYLGDHLANSEYIKVIGNIYENPELLEVKQ